MPNNIFLNISSEIGKLKAVLLHRPGRELERLTPQYIEELLFDDIPWLSKMRKEHDAFAKIMKDATNTLSIALGVIITYNRNEVSNEFLRENGIEVIEIEGSELVRGRGGPRCMSMPLIREEI